MGVAVLIFKRLGNSFAQLGSQKLSLAPLVAAFFLKLEAHLLTVDLLRGVNLERALAEIQGVADLATQL